MFERSPRLSSNLHKRYIAWKSSRRKPWSGRMTPCSCCEPGKKCAFKGMAEWVAADSARCTGTSSCEKLCQDHRSVCAPVSAMAETSVWLVVVETGPLYLAWAEVSTKMMDTLGWSGRCARFQSPLVKTWSVTGVHLWTMPCVAAVRSRRCCRLKQLD